MGVTICMNIFMLVCAHLAWASFPAQMKIRRDYIAHMIDHFVGTTALVDGNYRQALSDYDAKLTEGSNILQKKVRVADIYVNKAVAYSKLGLFHYSLKFLNLALGLKQDNIGSQSYAVGAILNNIGSVYADRAPDDSSRSTADRKIALEFYTKALNLFLRKPSSRRAQPTTGNDALMMMRNLTIANTYHNMAIVHQELGQYHEAEYHFHRSWYLQNTTKGVGMYSHLQAETHYYLGALYDEQQLWDKGLAAYVSASKVDLSVAGIGTELLEPVMFGLTLFRRNQGRVHLTVDSLISTLNQKLYHLGWNHMSTSITYMLMGGAYEETANYTEALKFYEKAHAGLVGHIPSDHHRQERHLFDKQHILLMDVYNKMGLLEDRRAHYSAAMTYFGYAMNMTNGLHTSPGPSFWNNSVEYDKHVLGMRFTDRDGYSTAAFSPYAANVNSNKAHVHFMRGEYTDAIDQCDISTNIRVDELDTDEHNSIGWNHFLRAKAEDDNGACDTNSYKAARDIYNVVLGPRHSQSMAVGALQTCA